MAFRSRRSSGWLLLRVSALEAAAHSPSASRPSLTLDGAELRGVLSIHRGELSRAPLILALKLGHPMSARLERALWFGSAGLVLAGLWWFIPGAF